MYLYKLNELLTIINLGFFQKSAGPLIILGFKEIKRSSEIHYCTLKKGEKSYYCTRMYIHVHVCTITFFTIVHICTTIGW